MKYLLTVLTLLVLLTGCGNEAPEEAEENENNDAVPVYVKEVQSSTFRHYLNVQGTVESDKTIMISPKTSATVKEVLVQEGDKVNQNAVLARLDGEITRSQIQEVQTQLELAQDLYDRRKNLREQEIGSEVEYLQAKNQVESLENQLATLQEQFDNYTIKATIGGTINRVMLKEGEAVGPTAPVFQLSNSEALKVTANISEAYITRVERTDTVEISFTSIDETIQKPLDMVSNVIDASNRTFEVKVNISSLNGMIRPNMIAKLKINDITEPNSIAVPVNTVQQANDHTFVFTAEQQGTGWVAVQKEVVPGLSYGNELVIKEGLNPGDIIITTGYNDVADGDAISIQEN